MTRRVIGAPLALALGFLPVAGIDAVMTLTRHGGASSLEVRALHLAYLLGYRAALALVLALFAAALIQVIAAWPTRARLGQGIAALLLVAVSIAVGAVMFADDLYSYLPLTRIALSLALSLIPAGVVLVGSLVAPIESWRARRAPQRSRGRRLGERALLRIPFALVGVGAALANHIAIPFGNPGPHLGLLLVAGMTFAMAILGLELPAFTRHFRGGPGRVLAVAFAAWAVWSLATKPPSRVSTELARNDSPGLYAFVAPLWAANEADMDGPPLDPTWLAQMAGDPRWFVAHDEGSPVPPSRPLVDPAATIVVLITIDALRQDVFADPKNAAVMPVLQALRGESVVFTRAHASSSSTAPSIGSIFTGRYLSQLYWTPVSYKGGRRIRYYPVEDESPRLGELLPAAVRSFNLPTIERLHQEYALIRGMREEAQTDTEEDLLAADVMPILGDWARRLGAAPGFAHVHLMDGHSPYTSAGTEGPVFARYVREFGRLDAQLGEFIAALEREGLWSRTVLILAADHGEAFGEHGQTEHGGSLYEELTRVPILIRVPGQAARTIDQAVSLIDLGPTILDLFQQPTPAGFQGQSLLPLVAGGAAALDRPIALESTRLHRALIFSDGLKCIWRSREAQYELYDLNRDPGELDNIVDSEPTAALRIAAVRKFFGAHALVRPGYTIPHYW